MLLSRVLTIPEVTEDSVFLWGARQTGKSTLLKSLFPDAVYYDLLLPNVYSRLKRKPELLIQELEVKKENHIVIIDEVQMLPELLNAVHWLIENKGVRFLLCGSSARKLKRLGANMLGGRAVKRQLFPFVSCEIPDFDLIKACNNGMLPRHYLTDDPENRLEGYIGNYLQQEIEAEAILRKIGVFTRFLTAAAFTDGEMVNYKNIASECGVSVNTIRGYFDILQDTMIGYMLPAYTTTKKRRLIKSPKFYFFDIGLVNHLLDRHNITPGSADFGHALEHFFVQELFAYVSYRKLRKTLSYWRTTSGYEVDLVYGDAEVAIEIKSSTEVQSRHLHGLKAFGEEHPRARLITTSLDETRRIMNGVEIWPIEELLQAIWNDEVLS